MNELVKVFECEGMGNVRVMNENDNILFVAKDICDCLGLSEVSNSLKRLDDDEKLTRKLFVSGQNRDTWVITEGGLYSLILTSNKPEAKKFKKWVTSEVLPSIRKNGGYIVEKEDDTDDDILARALVIAQDKIKKREERIKALENRVEVDKPKVEYYERVIESESTFTTTQIAKELFMSAKQLNLILSNMGVQFKQSKQWMLYNKYQDKGYMKTRTTPYVDSQGIQQTNHISVWTEKGREFIHDLVEDL
jgi:anti-repressor protein